MSRKCAGCKKWLAAGQYDCRYCGRGERALKQDVKVENLTKLRAWMCGSEAVANEMNEKDAVLLLAVFGASDVLDESVLDECLVHGRSTALFDALMKRGLTIVSAQAMETYLDGARTRAENAATQECALAGKEERLRHRVLKGDVNVAARESDELSSLRAECERLRSTVFLQHVLSVIVAPLKGDSANGKTRAKALAFIGEQEAKRVAPASENPLASTPSSDVIRADVSPQGGLDALRNAISVATDTVCGKDRANEPDMRVEVSVSDTRVTLSGSLVQYIRQSHVVIQSTTGKSIQTDLVRNGRLWTASVPQDSDHRFPVTLSIVVVWFPAISQTTVRETYAFRIIFNRPPQRFAFPMAFSRPLNLAAECLELLENPHAGEKVRGGAIVQLQGLFYRVKLAIIALLEEADPTKGRHLWTLLLIRCSMSRQLSIDNWEDELYKRALQLCYRPVDDNFFSSESIDCSRYIGSSEWLARAESGWIGKAFSDEFVTTLRTEVGNLAVLSGGKVNLILADRMHRVLEKTCEQVWNSEAENFNPLQRRLRLHRVRFTGGQVTDPTIFPAPIAAAEISLHLCLDRMDSSRATRLLALAMARHPRLGADSILRILPKDMFRYLADCIPAEKDPMSRALEGHHFIEIVNDNTSLIRPCIPGQTAVFKPTPSSHFSLRGKTTVNPHGLNAKEYHRTVEPLFMHAEFSRGYCFPEFVNLPKHLQVRIGYFLSPRDLGRLELSGKLGRQLVVDNDFYRKHCLRRGYIDSGTRTWREISQTNFSHNASFWDPHDFEDDWDPHDF